MPKVTLGTIRQDTTIDQLEAMARQAPDGAKIRGKTNKDGSITLYASTKNKGIFSTAKTRENKRTAAKNALSTVFRNISSNMQRSTKSSTNPMDTALGNIVARFTGTEDMTGLQFKTAISDAMDEKRTHMMNQLPDGIQIDHTGKVTGHSTLTHLPSTGGMEGLEANQSLEDMYNAKVNESLIGGDKETINGIPISGQGVKDLYRLDMEIPTSTGVYKSREDGETGEHERTETAVTKLRDFTGSDQATTVLSTILNQSRLRPIHDSLQKGDGTATPLRFPAKRMGSMITEQGRQDFLLTNYGGAKWKLSKTPEGNFKLSVDWPLHFDGLGRMNDVEPLPLHEGGVLRAHFTFDMIIDAHEAEQGRAVITMPNGVRVDYSGKLSEH